MTRLRTLLVIVLVSLASFSLAQDDSKRITALEFTVQALEKQVAKNESSIELLSSGNVRLIEFQFNLNQYQKDLDTYIANQEKQNNRLWQFLIGPIIIGLVQVWFIPRLVAKQVDNHMTNQTIKKE